MPRKILPNPIVTYTKKITYISPENNKNSFWSIFFQIFLVQILAVVAGSLTAGVGVALVQGLGFSQLGIATTSMLIQTGINFGINQTYDYLMGTNSTQSTMFNLIFGITDIGVFGRAIKYDKLLKILNQEKILSRIGITNKVRNFYQIKEALKYKDIIIRSINSNGRSGVKKSFEKTITDVEILQTILEISTIELKRNIKNLTQNELKAFLEVEKLLYKINPGLLPNLKNIDIKKYNKSFKNETKIDIEDFFKLDDQEALKILSMFNPKIGIGNAALAQINRLRIQSQFQKSLFENFMLTYKTAKKNIKKLNPFRYLNKIVNQMMEPITKALEKISIKVNKYLPKINKILRKTLKEYNLIPCQPKSYLLGFRFTPTTPTGEGYIEIWKKPYFWKTKPGKISNYNKVRAWTNLIEVEKFALSKKQNQFYEEIWGLGRGFSQGNNKVLSVLSPGLYKIYRDINKILRTITITKSIFKAGVVASLKSYSNTRISRIFNSVERKLLLSPFKKIPGLNLVAANFADLIKGQGWNNKKLFNNAIKKATIKKARKVRIIYV